MSARRREETIARFSVPIESDSYAPSLSQATAPPSSQTTEPTTSQRSARRSTRSSRSIVVDSAVDDDRDDDFVMGEDQDDDSDDFIDDDDDDAPPRTQSKRGKGKAAAKGKGKASIPTSTPVRTYQQVDGVNPRVMLISLKAGALGLNLTVANNVYLCVVLFVPHMCKQTNAVL